MKQTPQKKYYFECSIILTIFCILVFLLFCFVDSILAAILSVLLYVFARLLITISAQKNFLSILFKDLDPQQFQRVIFSNKKNIPPISYRIYAAICTGDYQTAVNICVKKIKEKSSTRNKCSYLTVLAHIYFELGDVEKLSLICNKFYEYAQKSKKPPSFESRYPFMHYCYHFINADYDECIRLCKDNNTPNATKNKLMVINQHFKYAMAFYHLGQSDKAMLHFNQIVQIGPKLHLASISQKYIEEIGSNLQIPFSRKTIIPDEDYDIFDAETLSKIRKRRAIYCILVTLSILLVFLSYIFKDIAKDKPYMDSQYNEAIIIYESKLTAALDKSYDTYAMIAYFDVFYDDKYIETLCLVDTDNQFDLMSIVSFDNGETFDLVSVEKLIEIDSNYRVKSSVSNYYLKFSIFQSKDNFDNYYKVIEYQSNGQTLWFCLECIEAIPE